MVAKAKVEALRKRVDQVARVFVAPQPEAQDEAAHDTGHRERAIGIPTLLAFDIRDNAAHDALPFIGTKANHVRPRLEAARKHEMLHHPDFELLGAEARDRKSTRLNSSH